MAVGGAVVSEARLGLLLAFGITSQAAQTKKS
jgi:hypothetical protein